MDGSLIVLDTTGTLTDTSSSVICLDSSIESSTPAPHTLALARNLCQELQESDRESTHQKSLIVISDDTSEDETNPKVNVEKQVPTQDKNKEEPLGNKDGGSKGKKRKRSEKQATSPPSRPETSDLKGEEEEEESVGGDKKPIKRRSSARLAAMASTPSSTPSEPHRKLRKIQVNASTPVSGAMSSPALPAVTPITVKYERIRSELSATKKMMHQTLLSTQEAMKAQMNDELEKIRGEFANKQKDDDSKLIDVKCDEDSVLRPVVIDGSNIAMSHGNNKVFSCKGIALCVQYFQQRGHKDISVLLPLHRKTAAANRACKMTNAHILDDLESKGLLSFTPSRQLHGRRVTPYDDRFILELACRNGGVIVSNDNYRDLMKESEKFKHVVEKRLIMYVFSGDNFMVPEDPHGRYGPSLTDVLRKDSEWSRMASPRRHPGAQNPSLLSIVHGPMQALRRSPRIAKILIDRGITSRVPDNQGDKKMDDGSSDNKQDAGSSNGQMATSTQGQMATSSKDKGTNSTQGQGATSCKGQTASSSKCQAATSSECSNKNAGSKQNRWPTRSSTMAAKKPLANNNNYTNTNNNYTSTNNNYTSKNNNYTSTNNNYTSTNHSKWATTSNNSNNNRGLSSNMVTRSNNLHAISTRSNNPPLYDSYPNSAQNNTRLNGAPFQNYNSAPFQNNVLTKFAHQLVNNYSQTRPYSQPYSQHYSQPYYQCQLTGGRVYYP